MIEGQRRAPANAELRVVIDNFVATAETCDVRRVRHQDRVRNLCCAMGERLGLDQPTLRGLSVSASLHDLGLLNVPEEIIGKPTRLTDDEIALIKKHPQIGYDFLQGVDFPWPVADIVLQHHEYFDGSGYPNGLAGKQIRLEAKILSLADTVEAITSKRPHRSANTVVEAVEEVEERCGSLYDPEVVDAFLRLVHGGNLFVKGWFSY